MKTHKGIALLQVLLIFALLSIVAVKLQVNQRINIERAQQSLFYSQATVLLDSAEALAEVSLLLDERFSETDHLYEQWNTTDIVIPLSEPQGTLDTQLNDLQGRFNVNWLSMDSDFRDGALAAFKRLLTLIGQSTDIADELYAWFDPESGADYFYLDKSPSYAPSFHPLADVSEMNLLNSVDSDIYQAIFPFLSTLPASSALNINTAPVEILQSVASFIDEETATSMLTDRGEEGFEQVTQFTQYPVFTINQDKSVNIPNLTVSSQWFELYTEVTIETRSLSQASILSRYNDQVVVVMRNRSINSANLMPGNPQ